MSLNPVLTQVLSLITVSLFSGVLLFIAFVLVRSWRTATPEDFLQWMSAHFFRFPKIMVPLNLLALLTSIAALAMSWSALPSSHLPLVLGIMFLLACTVTYPIYFAGANEAFLSKSVDLSDIPSAIENWSNWHWTRTVLALISAGFIGWTILRSI